MKITETDRLILRQATVDDAPFIFQLLNEPSWLQYIGDRNIRTLGDAENYIRNGLIGMYAQHGFGLFIVELKNGPTPIGLCGLIKRDSLEDVDLGFAFLPAYWGQGYAWEAASATMHDGATTHGLSRLLAITLPENASSIKLLKRLGFKFEKLIRLADDAEALELYAINL